VSAASFSRRGVLSALAAGAGAATLFFAFPHDVEAAAKKPMVDVVQIRASMNDAGGSIDPDLADIHPLTHGPLTKSFNTFKFLGRQTLTLDPTQAVTTTLVTGQTAALTILDATARHRLKLHLELSDGSGADPTKVDFRAGRRGYVIVGPFPYDNASLFVAVTRKQ
jgi:hypothetical protein